MAISIRADVGDLLARLGEQAGDIAVQCSDTGGIVGRLNRQISAEAERLGELVVRWKRAQRQPGRAPRGDRRAAADLAKSHDRARARPPVAEQSLDEVSRLVTDVTKLDGEMHSFLDTLGDDRRHLGQARRDRRADPAAELQRPDRGGARRRGDHAVRGARHRNPPPRRDDFEILERGRPQHRPARGHRRLADRLAQGQYRQRARIDPAHRRAARGADRDGRAGAPVPRPLAGDRRLQRARRSRGRARSMPD